MRVTLLHSTPLEVADRAIGKCWDKQCSTINKPRLKRVGVQNKHESTLEHISYNFDIDGISRACLQELARHRISSFSVKSTRYTLGELQREKSIAQLKNYLIETGDMFIDDNNWTQLILIKKGLEDGKEPDKIKYMLPEAYKTSLVWTVNLRSLRNFLALRTSKRALEEIQELANNIYNTLPEEHKFLAIDCIQQATEEIRTQHFEETGEYSQDDEILEWYKNK